ncbi:MAG: hypothetical protein U1F70_05645 [Candidatus Competibacteraceae bacterium]
MNDIDDLIESLSIEQLEALIEKAQHSIQQKKAGEIEDHSGADGRNGQAGRHGAGRGS